MWRGVLKYVARSPPSLSLIPRADQKKVQAQVKSNNLKSKEESMPRSETKWWSCHFKMKAGSRRGQCMKTALLAAFYYKMVPPWKGVPLDPIWWRATFKSGLSTKGTDLHFQFLYVLDLYFQFKLPSGVDLMVAKLQCRRTFTFVVRLSKSTPPNWYCIPRNPIVLSFYYIMSFNIILL